MSKSPEERPPPPPPPPRQQRPAAPAAGPRPPVPRPRPPPPPVSIALEISQRTADRIKKIAEELPSPPLPGNGKDEALFEMALSVRDKIIEIEKTNSDVWVYNRETHKINRLNFGPWGRIGTSNDGQIHADLAEAGLTLVTPKENRDQALAYSTVLIAAVTEMLGEYQSRKHNRGPADEDDDQEMLKAIKSLLFQLKKINKIVGGHSDTNKVNERARESFGKAADKYLDNLATTGGKMTAYVVVAAIVALANHLGMTVSLTDVLQRIKFQ